MKMDMETDMMNKIVNSLADHIRTPQERRTVVEEMKKFMNNVMKVYEFEVANGNYVPPIKGGTVKEPQCDFSTRSDGMVKCEWEDYMALGKIALPNGVYINNNGDVCHVMNGYFHNDNGPAIKCADGSCTWFTNGQLYKLSDSNGELKWYVDGMFYYSEAEYEEVIAEHKINDLLQ